MSRSILLSLALFVTTAFTAQLMGEEEHPRIERSIHELEETIHFLEGAAHDYGGHRDEAIRACREAIHQLREALGFARHDH
jgi:hypothetical protein